MTTIQAKPCAACGTVWGSIKLGRHKPSRTHGKCAKCYQREHNKAPKRHHAGGPLKPSEWRIHAFCAVFRRRCPREPYCPALVPGSRHRLPHNTGTAYFVRPYLEL